MRHTLLLLLIILILAWAFIKCADNAAHATASCVVVDSVLVSDQDGVCFTAVTENDTLLLAVPRMLCDTTITPGTMIIGFVPDSSSVFHELYDIVKPARL
jgi:flagellar biogenesis protein FliO